MLLKSTKWKYWCLKLPKLKQFTKWHSNRFEMAEKKMTELKIKRILKENTASEIYRA